MMWRHLLVGVLAWLAGNAFAPPLLAQRDSYPGPRPGERLTQNWEVGMIIRARGGPCANLVGSFAVPSDWPEQSVRVVDEEFTRHVRRQSYQNVDGGARQMVVSVPQLPPGEVCKAMVTFEITKMALLPPEDPTVFVMPENAPRDVRIHLAPSPQIESRHNEIRSHARDTMPKGDATAWESVETLFDWVRDNVEYQEGPLKGGLAALRDGSGNHEDLTSLFIAMCRANGVPARTVWVPDHCYAEFYLQDEEGEGYWFPCMVAGPREFGGVSDLRPILQKGDNIRVRHSREPQRYLAEHLAGRTGAGLGRPAVNFIRQLQPLDD